MDAYEYQNFVTACNTIDRRTNLVASLHDAHDRGLGPRLALASSAQRLLRGQQHNLIPGYKRHV